MRLPLLLAACISSMFVSTAHSVPSVLVLRQGTAVGSATFTYLAARGRVSLDLTFDTSTFTLQDILARQPGAIALPQQDADLAVGEAQAVHAAASMLRIPVLGSYNAAMRTNTARLVFGIAGAVSSSGYGSTRHVEVTTADPSFTGVVAVGELFNMSASGNTKLPADGSAWEMTDLADGVCVIAERSPSAGTFRGFVSRYDHDCYIAYYTSSLLVSLVGSSADGPADPEHQLSWIENVLTTNVTEMAPAMGRCNPNPPVACPTQTTGVTTGIPAVITAQPVTTTAQLGTTSPLTTAPLPTISLTTTTAAVATNTGPSDPSSLVFGVVIAAILFAVLVLVIIAIFLLRRSRGQHNSSSSRSLPDVSDEQDADPTYNTINSVVPVGSSTHSPVPDDPVYNSFGIASEDTYQTTSGFGDGREPVYNTTPVVGDDLYPSTSELDSNSSVYNTTPILDDGTTSYQTTSGLQRDSEF
jgi:hypothetical protein